MNSEEWYYTNQGRQFGPVTLQQLAAELHELPNWREEYVWRDGFDSWARAGGLKELRIIPQPPPRPQPPPSPGAPSEWSLANVLVATTAFVILASCLGIALIKF